MFCINLIVLIHTGTFSGTDTHVCISLPVTRPAMCHILTQTREHFTNASIPYQRSCAFQSFQELGIRYCNCDRTYFTVTK